VNLAGQTLVITGATSGFGLSIARLAARRGARLLLVARSGPSLARVAATLGAEATWVAADVADPEQVRAIEARAVERFGGFGGWIHAAGVGLHAPVLRTAEADHRRLFEVNFWGTLHCVRLAANHLRHKGGAIVVVSSILGDRALPWQGALSAAEHARKAWCDALRMELRHDRIPVRITVLQPGGFDTPFSRRSATPKGRRATVPPPLYHPDVLARVALRCLRSPHRDLVLGDSSPVALEKFAPRLGDRLLAAVVGRRLRTAEADDGALYVPHPPEGVVRARPRRPVLRHSLRAALALHRLPVLLAATSAAGAALLARRT